MLCFCKAAFFFLILLPPAIQQPMPFTNNSSPVTTEFGWLHLHSTFWSKYLAVEGSKGKGIYINGLTQYRNRYLIPFRNS